MNSGIGTLIDNLQSKGISVLLIGGVVKVQGDGPPDQDAAKLLDELKQRKDEVKAVLSSDDLLKRESCVVGAEVVQQFIVNGDLKAVEICSRILEDHLYLLIDRAFELPNKSLAVYFPEELEFLKTKDIEQLKSIHRTKLVFPGCRVVQ